MDREYVQNEVFWERDNSRDIKAFIYKAFIYTLGVEPLEWEFENKKKLLKNNKNYRFNAY